MATNNSLWQNSIVKCLIGLSCPIAGKGRWISGISRVSVDGYFRPEAFIAIVHYHSQNIRLVLSITS
jgi:hypothetical protein